MRQWLLQSERYELCSMHCLQFYAVPNYCLLHDLEPEPSLHSLQGYYQLWRSRDVFQQHQPTMLAMCEWVLQGECYKLCSLHGLQFDAVPNHSVLYYLQPKSSLFYLR